MAKSNYNVTVPATITAVVEAADDEAAAEKFKALAKAVFGNMFGVISIVGDPKVAIVASSGKSKASAKDEPEEEEDDEDEKEEEDEDEPEEEEEDEDDPEEEEEDEKPKKAKSSDKKPDKKADDGKKKIKIKLKG